MFFKGKSIEKLKRKKHELEHCPAGWIVGGKGQSGSPFQKRWKIRGGPSFVDAFVSIVRGYLNRINSTSTD